MSAAALAAYIAARNIHYTQMVASLLFPVIFLSLVAAVVFLLRSETGRGKWIETMSCIWALMMYLSLGIVPALLRCYGGQK
jgi:membrane protein YdbS with pleckstrin-like domain